MNSFFSANGTPQHRDNTNRHFMGQQATEEVTLFLRKHWVTIFPQMIVLLGTIFLTPPLFLLLRDLPLLVFFLLAASALVFHRMFVHLFNHYLRIIILTNYRLIELEKTLILRDTKCVIDLTKIQDIEKRQTGLLKNILNYGELILHLSSSSNTITFYHVPKPDRFFREINRVKREYILRRQEQKHQAVRDDTAPSVAAVPASEQVGVY